MDNADTGRVLADQALVSEVWATVAGYDGLYEVSNLGAVRSLHRGSVNLMSQVLDGTGYPTVKLYKNGHGTRFKVHRLVCQAFHGPPPFDGAQAAHLDGTRDNARADNLVWATRSENERHKRAHGTVRGRLNEADASLIRKRAGAGESARSIAASIGVSESHAYRVIAGERWQ